MIKERIILSNSLNETEFLRTLAINNKNTIGLYVYNEIDFLSYILIKNGVKALGKLISRKEEIYIYMDKLSIKYDEASSIQAAVSTYRDQKFKMDNFDLLDNAFAKKKSIISQAYSVYNQYKIANNLIDKYDLINYINENLDDKIDVTCIVFKELLVSNLVKELAKKLFNLEEYNIKDFVCIDNKLNQTFAECYGKKNEISYVFKEIYNQKINLGDCTLLLLNNSDIYDIIPYLEKFNLKYTSLIGVPAVLSNYIKLLKQILELENDNSVNGFINFFNSNVIKKTELFKGCSLKQQNDIIKFLGWLRLSFFKHNNLDIDVYEDEYKDKIKFIFEEFKKGIVYFISQYGIPDKYSGIIGEIKEIEGLNYSDEIKINLYENLINSYIDNKISASDAINIVNINNMYSCVRKYTFVIGLDENFPGNPVENYFIYDDEYSLDQYKSFNIVENKKNMLNNYLDLCNNLYLSYSSFKLDDLKDVGPSSVFYDRKGNSDIFKFDYSDDSISNNMNIIKKYNENNVYNPIPVVTNQCDNYKDILLKKTYYASQFHNAFEKGNMSFILQSLLDVNIDDEKDPYAIIDSDYKGTLLHSIFEEFNKTKISLNQIKDKSSKAFDNFIKMKPALIQDNIQKAKDEFVELAESLYEISSNNLHVLSEKKMELEVYGVKFKGTFDRIEKNSNGEYILVDYKTGRNITHKENDPKTCIQGLIYAYMIENLKDDKGDYLINDNGNRICIKECNFLYPYYKRIITIKWDKNTKEKLEELISEFKERINKGTILKGIKDDKYSQKYMFLNNIVKEVKKC